MDEPIFNTVHGALSFAYTYQGNPDTSSVNRMGQEPSRIPGKGLIGIDGAAQAGFIQGRVRKAGVLAEAFIIGEFMPRCLPCDCVQECCSGYKPNKAREGAITYLSNVLHEHVLAGHRTNKPIRVVCVESFFDKAIHVTQTAENIGISRNLLTLLMAKSREYLSEEKTRCRILVDDLLDCLIIKK